MAEESGPLVDLAVAEDALLKGDQSTSTWKAVEGIRRARRKIMTATAQREIAFNRLRHDWNADR